MIMMLSHRAKSRTIKNILFFLLFFVLSGCSENNFTELGKDFGFDSAGQLTVLDDSVIYVGSKNGKNFVVQDGKIIFERSDEYPGLFLQAVDNKLVIKFYETGDYPKKSKVFFDGKIHEIASGADLPDLPWNKGAIGDGLYSPPVTNIGNKLISVVKTSYGKDVLALDGERITKEYYSIRDVNAIGGKIAFVAVDAIGSEFVVFDGREGKKYSDISVLTDVNGIPAYFARKGRIRFVGEKPNYFVVYGEKEFGPFNAYGSYQTFASSQGKFIFEAPSLSFQHKIYIEK